MKVVEVKVVATGSGLRVALSLALELAEHLPEKL